MGRQLSSLEQFFYYRSKWGLHSCFLLGVTLDRTPSQAQFAHAIHECLVKFPQLTTTVVELEQGTPTFANITVPLRYDDFVEVKQWGQWDAQLANEIFKEYNFQYTVEKPLWRILAMPKSSTFVLLVDHVLFDGMSTVNLWRCLLENLGPESTSDVLYEPSNEADQLGQRPHPYDSWPVGWSWRLKRALVPWIFYYAPRTVTGVNEQLVHFSQYTLQDNLLQRNKPEEYKIYNDNDRWVLNIKGEPMAKLITRCKEHQVSLTSYLVSVFALALSYQAEGNIRVDIPMNTRNKCKETVGVTEQECLLGNFVGGISHTYQAQPGQDIWRMAREAQTTVVQKSQDDIDDTINEVKLLDVVSIQKFLAKKLEERWPAGTFEVTNLGFQKFPGDDGEQGVEFQVQDAFFDEPQGISDIFTVAAISTKHGGLNCCISSPVSLRNEFQPVWDRVKKEFGVEDKR
ncbi:N-acetyltransferase KNAG_0G00700 [Huiozyma naganishii CBS 8797]|uniref:Condensation domain-containing protein n=1 Tax=Huiozyma naganishii (strain ATCC MYA-139 / BCRC 22969 / CBS 8797 / KCTC 17520 / NBRC 10181 / NCYC 3082 / Yp74L-3) TaxID=1071383 RepID=J7S8V4_HUIN7|nr:hypothetical protein KNAG_0G00700 [Kazachstania naganishii CBS 8797]CCK71126.1 hypothetical protein KNAG_0G00700 [Kazachstania naganishii CBS 8797]